MFDGSVLIRVDSGRSVGHGHVSRCLALAAELSRLGARVVFAVRGLRLAASIGEAGHESRVVAVRELAVGADVPRDEVEQTLALAREIRPRWVVIDHYGWTDDRLARLRDGAWRLALIDDVASRDARAVDLLINPSLDADASAYALRPEATALLGPLHAPLHAAYARLRDEGLARTTSSLDRLLVAFGGADTAGQTGPVVAELDALLPPEVEIRVIRGPLCDGADLTPGASGRIRCLGPLAPAALAREFVEADAALATPSTICWEMATLGLPLLLLRTADNQALNARGMARRGAARVATAGSPVAGHFSADGGLLDPEVRSRLSRRAAGVTDGRGAVRVARAMCEPAVEQQERACAS